jgi:putative heme-binding domain-containing protein
MKDAGAGLGRWVVAALATMIAAVAHAADVPLLEEALRAEDRAALAAAVVQEGDPLRGSNVFHARQMACTQCHVVGEGVSPLGPNLAAMPKGVSAEALVGHLVQAVLEPSAVVQPDYRGLTVITDDGKSITGLLARETEREIVLRDATAGGREIVIPLDTVDERVPAQASLMPSGLANLLADRQQFLDLIAYLAAVARGGPEEAKKLAPDPLLLASQAPAAYESEIDHAAFIRDWSDEEQARESFERGEKLFHRVCANCHGTLDAPGSLPTAPRFAEGKFKAGSDPYAIYRTLTFGNGMMVSQNWMVPSQKYDVIHYLRETFLKDRNPTWYAAITPEYLASLPAGTTRGPEPSMIEPWRLHDYGPFLAGTFEVGKDKTNIARKGLVVRLDDGPGGVGRGHAWVLYELDTMRVAAFWTGDQFIDWSGINFDGRHGAHPHVAGEVQFATPTMPGWANPETGSFDDPRPLGRDNKPYGPLPRDHVRFKALHHVGVGGTAGESKNAVVLEYQVGSTTVLETPSLAPSIDHDGKKIPMLLRSFSFGPREGDLKVTLADGSATAFAFYSKDGSESEICLNSGGGLLDVVFPKGIDRDVLVAVVPWERASTTDVLNDRNSTRVVEDVETADFEKALDDHVHQIRRPPAPRTLVGRPAPNLWATTVETKIGPRRDSGPFAVDVLTAPEANPWNAQVRFSGIDFTGSDEAVICSWDGDVWRVKGITSPTGTLTWRRIASGLFQPLGIKVIKGEIFVGCRDRILKLVDLNGDGMTDRYDTFNDDHQVTEHFHEFAMGLETDAAGNVYYAKSARHGLPAVVPHHGTLIKVSPDGKTTEIVANGFRAANGVCVEEDGTFWVTDQEGHWNPKNRINHVRQGGFYGNMFGYHDVTDSSDSAMIPPAMWITNAFDRSPAELVRVKSAKWQPIDGALLELSYGEGRVHLVLTEPASGERGEQGVSQGGLVALPIPDLPTGIMRGRFNAADGQFYVCGLYAWAGNRQHPGGFFRIRRTEQPLTIPVALHAEPGKLAIEFPLPLGTSAADMKGWKIRAWDLERTKKYGSDHLNERDLPVTAAQLSSDGRRVELTVPGFGPTWCYSLKWDMSAADGTPIKGVLHGTMH